MRKTALLMVLAASFLIASGATVLAKGNGPQGASGPGYFYDYPNDDEITELLHMREEEKLARDVYLHFYETYEYFVFSNIAASEQQHMNTLGKLIVKYDLEDPVGDDVRGVFQDGVLQGLYDNWTDPATGPDSLEGALEVGATIEDLDIADLIHALGGTDNEDQQTAYVNLMKGSRNHLRAFVAALNQFEQTYTRVYICQDLFDAIIDSDREKGHYRIEDAPVYPDCSEEGEEPQDGAAK